jgi:predicted lysophospholipase L1 biosynthesis ABC-type transport system permease subunit
VLRSVLTEAVLMGLVASLLGIGFGVLLAIGLNALFTAIGIGLPTAPISIPIVTSVLLPLAVGTGAALIASLAPAIKATRVPPIAALREGFVLPPGRLAPYVPYIGATVAALGVGLIAYSISDQVGPSLDHRYRSVVVMANATTNPVTYAVPDYVGRRLSLHPVQVNGADPVVKTANFARNTGTFTIPPRTIAVFVERRDD